MEMNLDSCKGYKTEANLKRALARLGLDDYDGCRYIICRKADGGWTAVFLVGEWIRDRGGYAGFASQHGFVSV